MNGENFVSSHQIYKSMVSHTREKLIDVARQLFAKKGVENTTMSDIASASDKGRRTIYTYFKSKRDIYEATIERDGELLVKHLRDVISQAPTAPDKLRCFLEHRLDLFESTTATPSVVSLDSILNLDFNRVDRVRRKAIAKEKEMLYEILDMGTADGSFDRHLAKLLMPVLQFLLQGYDLSVVNNNFALLDINPDTCKNDIVEFIINSLVTNKTTEQ